MRRGLTLEELDLEDEGRVGGDDGRVAVGSVRVVRSADLRNDGMHESIVSDDAGGRGPKTRRRGGVTHELGLLSDGELGDSLVPSLDDSSDALERG